MNSTECETTEREVCRRNRRKQYIVDPAFQWRYAITIALTVFLITSVMSSVLYGLLHHQARQRFLQPEVYTAEVAFVVLFSALAFSVVTAAGVGIWSVISTHRICGPLYVLERHLAELAKGRVPSPRALRRKDEFKNLYRIFSRAMNALKVKKQAELTALTEAVERARSAIDSTDEDRKRALEVLASRLETLQGEAAAALGETVAEKPAAPVSKQRVEPPVPVGAA